MSAAFTVKDLPRSERPRERLQKFGPEALSAQELIALILGRGCANESVMTTAQRLLSTFGDIKRLSEASLEELRSVRGIGPAKASQIKAAFQLAKRGDEDVRDKISVSNPGDVIKLVRPQLKDKKQEHFLALSLNARNCLIKISDISTGTVNASLVHPREVFREAISASAVSLVLVHNHPSGDPQPSEDDIKITRRLIEAGKIMGLEILDHIIIADKNFCSLKEKGIL